MTHEGWPRGGNYRHGQIGKNYAGSCGPATGGLVFIGLVVILFVWAMIAVACEPDPCPGAWIYHESTDTCSMGIREKPAEN